MRFVAGGLAPGVQRIVKRHRLLQQHDVVAHVRGQSQRDCQQTGRFPANFRELEARVWRHKQSPDFGADGRSLTVANYFYIYYPVDASTCTVWIVPVGPRRDEVATHFLLLTPSGLRRWKGVPLTLDEVKKLPSAVPQYNEMALLGMTEQQPIDLDKKK